MLPREARGREDQSKKGKDRAGKNWARDCFLDFPLSVLLGRGTGGTRGPRQEGAEAERGKISYILRKFPQE